MWFESIMAAVSIFSGIKGAQGAAAAARAQSTEAMANAKYLRQQAEFSRYMARLDMQAADIEHERHRGAQESIFSASGVSLSGSVMAALGESEKSIERNHFRRLVAAENDANMMIKRADMNDRLARNIESAGETRAQAALLGGLAGAGYWGYKSGLSLGNLTGPSPGPRGTFSQSQHPFDGANSAANLSARSISAGSSALTGGIGTAVRPSEMGAYSGFMQSMFPWPLGHSNKPIRRSSLGGSRY